MRIACLVTPALVYLLTVSPVQAADGLSAERLQRLERVMSEYVAAGRLPGVVYTVARNGELAHTGTAGDVKRDAIFRIYSMTKPITAVAVLMLFEEGRFLLGDPIARYLPEFAEARVLLADGTQRPAAGPITILQLLTHTAGLSYNGIEPGLPALYTEADLWSAPSLAEFSRRVAALPLEFDPGSAWRYSVANDVLGRLVEVLAGQPFDQYVAANITGPLGMGDTRFCVADEDVARFQDLYQRVGDGIELIESAEDSEFRDCDRVPFGGGGMVSTASDYLRFTQMLLNGGNLGQARLLSPKTVDLMMRDHLPAEWGNSRLDEAWVGRTENRNGSLELGLGHGLGAYVVTDVARNAVPGSAGTYAWGGAASTYFFIDPAEQLSAVFMTQLMPSDSYPLRAQFRALVYQAVIESRRGD